MKVKGFIIFFITVPLLAVLLLSCLLPKSPALRPDSVLVNDVAETLTREWADILKEKGRRLPLHDQLDYTVLDKDGEMIAATRRGLSENIYAAIENWDIMIDLYAGSELLGKVIIHNPAADIIHQNRRWFIRLTVLLIILLTSAGAFYTFYLYRTLLRPFHKMKAYAGQIASGNLDIPIEMDRNNLFGAFTESFDLMREELHKTRESERQATQSKKELVASLSHDIKTPVASIQAVTELMALTAQGKEEQEQLRIIQAKAEQINFLITNLFHATLEELQVLRVIPADVESTVIPGLIRNSDYRKLIRSLSILPCVVSADLHRLGQVFDNLIGNSYKYAGTAIEISTSFSENHLIIDIRDFGPGVPREELPFLFKKFYRGKDAERQNGYGLGLYISKYLLELMSGDIQCENRPDGFTVRLLLLLS